MTKIIRKTIDVHKKQPKSSKYVNIRLLDATTDSDIEKHIAEDDAAALFDAAEFAKSNKIDLTSKDVNWHNPRWPLQSPPLMASQTPPWQDS